MSTTVASPASRDFRIEWLAAPLLAMAYPLPLAAFHSAVGMVELGDGPLAWGMAAVSLALAFVVPLLALVLTARLSAIIRPSPAELSARRVALLAVAAPPRFTLLSVLLRTAGISFLDTWLFVALWGGLMAVIARANRSEPAEMSSPVSNGRLRIGHGVVAAIILAAFLLLHIGNHLLGLGGADMHKAAMKLLRHFYRATVVEPLLLVAFLALAVPGLRMAWRISARPMDGFRTFQVASGVFLAMYLVSHVTAVVPLARAVLGIDPNWDFATGAPTGLIRDAWSIRLVPYYALAVFFALAHPLAGARVVLLAHGAPKRFVDGMVVWGGALSALIAVVIMLGMCGLRIHFE